MKTTTKRTASALALISALAAAMPATAQEDRPNPFVAMQLSPEFMSARVRDELGQVAMIHALVPMNSVSYEVMPNPTPDAYDDPTIKRVLTALDVIMTRWMEPIARSRDAQAAFIQQEFAANPFRDRPNDPFRHLASDPQYVGWAKDHFDFVSDARGVVALSLLLQHLRPGLLASRHLPGGYDAEFTHRSKPPLANTMAAISAVIDLPDAAAYLPARFDLARLRARERQLRLTDEHQMQPFPELDLETEWVTQRVRDAWVQGVLHEASVRMSEEIDLMHERLALLADPVKSGACDRTQLDLASLAASGGDPTRVRKADGTVPDSRTMDWFSIHRAYLLGCGGRPDVAAARRTLQQWAERHPNDFRMSTLSHCTLVRWARYGIGGRPDEATAKAWEARALRDIGDPCRADDRTSLIDPRNPLLDLHR